MFINMLLCLIGCLKDEIRIIEKNKKSFYIFVFLFIMLSNLIID